MPRSGRSSQRAAPLVVRPPAAFITGEMDRAPGSVIF